MSNYLRAVFIAFGQPVILNRISRANLKYQEGKIIYQDREGGYGFQDGCYCKYKVLPYEFHNIHNNDKAINDLIAHVKRNPAKYVGVLDHVNLYFEGKKKGNNFYKQIKLT